MPLGWKSFVSCMLLSFKDDSFFDRALDRQDVGFFIQDATSPPGDQAPRFVTVGVGVQRRV